MQSYRRVHQALRAPALLKRTIASSSSSSSDPLKPSGFANYWRRCYERRHLFTEYENHQVFRPEAWRFNNLVTFLTLQYPSQTQINAIEFLQGVRIACTQQIQALYSADMAQALKESNDDHDVLTRLRSYCTPGVYDMLLGNVKKHMNRGITIESEDGSIQSAHLDSAEYWQLTEAQYEEQIHQKPSLWTPYGHTYLPEATIEHLRMTVHVVMEEKMRIRMEARQEELLVHQVTLYKCTFESRVNNEHDVNWRIASFRGLPLKAKEVERKPLGQKA